MNKVATLHIPFEVERAETPPHNVYAAVTFLDKKGAPQESMNLVNYVRIDILPPYLQKGILAALSKKTPVDPNELHPVTLKELEAFKNPK